MYSNGLSKRLDRLFRSVDPKDSIRSRSGNGKTLQERDTVAQIRRKATDIVFNMFEKGVFTQEIKEYFLTSLNQTNRPVKTFLRKN
ncbi:MAG: hypothetical protein JJW01_03265 [Alphaproteobacteria bacterium]|nr:hypothetical protein [Rickettsiales bacterium]